MHAWALDIKLYYPKSQLYCYSTCLHIAGKLPVDIESDMDWPPQPLDSDSMIAESPPPVPPKASETSTAHPLPSAIDHSAPALPPKPKSVNRYNTI